MKILNLIKSTFSIFVLKEFFNNDRNQLISARGSEIISDPDLMSQVNDQIQMQINEQKRTGRTSPIIIKLK